MNSTFVSIDIETTGLDEKTCQVIEIGAVIDDWLEPLESPPEFHCYIKRDQYNGEPFALSMHPAIFRRIATGEGGFDYLYPQDVMAKLGLWMRDNGAYGVNPIGVDSEPKAVVAGKNFASFDDKFLRQLPPSGHMRYAHRILDPCMLYWNPLIDVKPPDTKTCMKRAGLAGKVAHTALEDAKVVAKLIQIAVGRMVRPGALFEILHARRETCSK